MNAFIWFSQLLLAGAFLFVGAGKLFAYDKMQSALEAMPKVRPLSMSRGQAAIVGLLEIAGALAVIVPIDLWPPHVLPRLAAAFLAMLMVGAGIYHALRKESAAPSITLFLLALFIIVARWPR
jgi:uncharacterized membrane protein